MADARATGAIRYSLRLMQLVDDQPPTRRHCSAGANAICGCPTSAHLASACAVGGGVIRDTTASVVKSMNAHRANTEKCVPMWNTEKEQAILDVFYATQHGALQCVDATVTAAEPSSPDLACALQRREALKRK